MDDLGVLISEQLPRLRRYARALIGERARADDLVQDTLERAWRKFHLWRRGSDLRAWLFTIMHNVHVNQVISRKHERAASGEDEVADLPVRATQSDLLEVLDLSAALGRLPNDQREILLLIAIEEMTYEEVATLLGIPVGTVMSRLSRARERLRALLAGSGGYNVALKVVK